MRLAHEGEHHDEQTHTGTSTTGEHSGHVQASNTTPASSSFGENSQGLFVGGGIALVVLAAGLAAWLMRSSKKPATVVADDASE